MMSNKKATDSTSMTNIIDVDVDVDVDDIDVDVDVDVDVDLDEDKHLCVDLTHDDGGRDNFSMEGGMDCADPTNFIFVHVTKQSSHFEYLF